MEASVRLVLDTLRRHVESRHFELAERLAGVGGPLERALISAGPSRALVEEVADELNSMEVCHNIGRLAR